MIPKLTLFGITIYTYPLLMGIAWGLGVQVSQKLNELNQNKFKHINLYLAGVFLTSWLGAKLFYLATVEIGQSSKIAPLASFWLGGGFVFYGGLVFGIAFSILFALKTKQNLKSFNVFVPALCIGHGIGRIGCFMAGCCYGVPYDGVLSVHMHSMDRFPVQLLESFTLLAFGLVTLKVKFQEKKYLVAYYFAFYSIARFLFEFVRGDMIRGIWAFGLSTSQIISLLIAIIMFVLCCVNLKSSRSTSPLV